MDAHEIVEPNNLTREELLKRAALAAAVVGGGALVGTREAQARTARPAAAPKRGGTFIYGVAGGGAKDIIDAHTATNEPDFDRDGLLYESLFARDPNYNLVKLLADSFESNSKATVWTIRLRDGVTFHNGKTLGADDLIYSIQRVFKLPYAPPVSPLKVAGINPKKSGQIKKLDPLTIRLTLPAPSSILDLLFGTSLQIVPVGYDPKKPVGTGPFAYKSFTPGQQSVFTANANWWGGWEGIQGGPYFDEVRIVDISDDSARVNALQAGQVHAINAVPYGQIKVLEANKSLTVFREKGSLWRPFTMRVDVPPFNDNRVRQAMRLVVNRPQMVEQALSGEGRPGNDLYSPQDPDSISGILPQRHQDIAKAKSLLKQAGKTGLSVELTTSAVQGGVLEASQVLVQQAKLAGINIKMTTVDPGVFYGNQYLKWPFAVDWWGTSPYLYQAVTADGPTASWNETHWNNPKFTALFRQALATVDASKKKQIEAEMQRIQYNEGGYIIWGFPTTINAFSNKVTGMDVKFNNGQDMIYRAYKGSFV